MSNQNHRQNQLQKVNSTQIWTTFYFFTNATESHTAFTDLMTKFTTRYRTNSTLPKFPSPEEDYYYYYFADPATRPPAPCERKEQPEGDSPSKGSKYAMMTPEEWEQTGENLAEQAAKFILKLVSFRRLVWNWNQDIWLTWNRNKAEKIRNLDALLNKRAKNLEDQDSVLKSNLSKFKSKAADMVSDLDLGK